MLFTFLDFLHGTDRTSASAVSRISKTFVAQLTTTFGGAGGGAVSAGGMCSCMRSRTTRSRTTYEE